MSCWGSLRSKKASPRMATACLSLWSRFLLISPSEKLSSIPFICPYFTVLSIFLKFSRLLNYVLPGRFFSYTWIHIGKLILYIKFAIALYLCPNLHLHIDVGAHIYMYLHNYFIYLMVSLH